VRGRAAALENARFSRAYDVEDRNRAMHTLQLPRTATSSTTGLLAGVAVAIVWVLHETWWIEGALAVTFASATIAALADAATSRIPDGLVIIAATPIAIAMALAIVGGNGGGRLAGVAFGMGGLALPLLVIHVVSPGAMGFGDVKLAAALGGALGLVEPRASLVALCIASAGTAVVALVRRRSTIPFGPGLVLGAASALMLFQPILERRPAWR
jgi:leader peptidase (prepilin peptidase)/N-methyltransferase